jgi:GNAT superfamily N-acetyltransferase
MDPRQILDQFDREMRARPDLAPGDRVEETDRVVRVVGDHSWISYSRLDSGTAERAISEETEYFRRIGKKVEWKVFGHDRPDNLGELLGRAGYSPDATETMVVLDLTRKSTSVSQPSGVEIRRLKDPRTLATAVSVSSEAFGPGEGWTVEDYAARLSDPTFGLFMAYLGDVPVSVGRLDMPRGRAFASLWGGGTSPPYRHRGIYRALVEARARVARENGFRYLTVDALPTSRPILERLGFVPLTSATGWVFDPNLPV